MTSLLIAFFTPVSLVKGSGAEIESDNGEKKRKPT